MDRRLFLALLGGVATTPLHAGILQHPAGSAGKLICGAWDFVSFIDTRHDGSTVDRWGPNAKGLLIFDEGDRFSMIIAAEESRIFGVKSYFAFGGYKAEDKTLTFNFDGCSIGRLIGSTQERKILTLTANELRYINPRTSTGASAELLWKRNA